MAGWHDDGSEEQFQMDQERRRREFEVKQAEQRAKAAAMTAEYGPRVR